MPKAKRILDAAARGALARLRGALSSLEDIEEGTSFGNPTFKVQGRAFAVLDAYQGRDCLWMLVDPIERKARLDQPGWFPSPYDPRKTALCCDLDVVDWRRMKPFLRTSYQQARVKRDKSKT